MQQGVTSDSLFELMLFSLVVSRATPLNQKGKRGLVTACAASCIGGMRTYAVRAVCHINDVKSCERITESDWTRQDLVAEQLAVHAVTRPLSPF